MLKLILTTLLLKQVLSAPQPQSTRTEEEDEEVAPVILTKFHVNSTIRFRYSRTEVLAYYKNPATKSKKAVFNMVIPESAFISNFSMIIKGEEFTAEVKEKEEAKKAYEDALSTGTGAGLISKNTRNTNTFSVDINLEPGAKVEFRLTYEELLERRDGLYDYIININPGSVVEDFHVEVNINESLPLSRLSVPKLLESNEIEFSAEETESSIAEVTRDVDGSPNNARVVFKPSQEYQLEAGEQGVSGKFVVKYDVDRQGEDNEVQVIDGYFVHYFVPNELVQALQKHVVFVLDISGSMTGEKIRQLKDAMFTVFDDMTESDYFNIVAFNDRISHWDGKFTNIRGINDYDFDYSEGDNEEVLANLTVFQATEENKNLAISSVLELRADGGTNINDAILAGIEVTKEAIKKETLPENVKSMVIFLTDGLPSSGVTNDDEIKSNIQKSNEAQIPVFTIAFGADTDIGLLQDISSQNNAISKRIYEGSDAALQLEDFYAQISSPLLSKLKFDYVGGLVDNSSVSDSSVNTFFRGAEFIITGKLSENEGKMGLNVTGYGKDGLYHKEIEVCLRPSPLELDSNTEEAEESSGDVDYSDSSVSFPLQCLQPRVYPKSEAQSFLQKLFAFQHIKQVLKKRDTEQIEEKKQNLTATALELSLKNNFVTDLTSLVVIKPDEEPKVNKFVDNSGFRQSVNYKTASFSPGSCFGRCFGIQPLSLSFSTPQAQAPPVAPVAASYDQYDYSYDAEDESFLESFNGGGPREPATEAPLECSNGTLSLYSKTYNRGEVVELTESVADLKAEMFDNKAVTALITGDCCWEIYAEANYTGEVLTLKPGVKYDSVTSLGKLFRDVESVKKVIFVC